TASAQASTVAARRTPRGRGGGALGAPGVEREVTSVVSGVVRRRVRCRWPGGARRGRAARPRAPRSPPRSAAARRLVGGRRLIPSGADAHGPGVDLGRTGGERRAPRAAYGDLEGPLAERCGHLCLGRLVTGIRHRGGEHALVRDAPRGGLDGDRP